MQAKVDRIARRHLRRCLSKIEAVHDMPEVCKAAIRSEIHYCANDVLDILTTGDHDDEQAPRISDVC